MKKTIAVSLLSFVLVISSSCTKMGLKSLRFDEEIMQVFVGMSAPAPLVTDPADYDFSNLEWSSSDEYIAVVNDGYVTGIAPGYAEVTVKAGRKSARIGVYVTAINVTSFTVPSSIDVAPGYSTTFDVTSIKPEYAKIENLRFSPGQSDDLTLSFSGNTVTVTAGKDMANGSKGSISVSNADGSVEKKITVNYIYRPVTAVSLNVGSSLTLTVGETKTVSATVTPSNATDGALSWIVGNPSVISYDSESMTLTALSSGTSSLTAKAGEKSAICNVTVTGVPITGRNIMYTGADNAATFSVSGQSNVQWSSSNTNVATVDGNGVVTGKKAGWTTITANYSGALSYKELRIVDKDYTPTFYSNTVPSGKKDSSNYPIELCENMLTYATVLPSYGSATVYVGTNDGYTVTPTEMKELSDGKYSYYTVVTTGDVFADKVASITSYFASSYVKSPLPGYTDMTVTGPNRKTGTFRWNKSISSISISTNIIGSSVTATVAIGGTFSVSPGTYFIWVNPSSTFNDNQNRGVGRSVLADSSINGYTLVSGNAGVQVSTSKNWQCLTIASSTAKGTYDISIKEYPSITFKIKVI